MDVIETQNKRKQTQWYWACRQLDWYWRWNHLMRRHTVRPEKCAHKYWFSSYVATLNDLRGVQSSLKGGGGGDPAPMYDFHTKIDNFQRPNTSNGEKYTFSCTWVFSVFQSFSFIKILDSKQKQKKESNDYLTQETLLMK